MSDRTETAPEMAPRLAQLAADRAALQDAARPAAVARQRARDRLTARERLALLCDPDSFVETGALVRAEADAPGALPADGMITGGARIESRPVVVVAQDFTVMGGSSGLLGSRKLHAAVRRSLREGAPLVMLLDGGGHRIQDGQNSRHFAAADPVFNDLARLSGWVPVIAAVLGAGFAAPTNYVGMADFVVMPRTGAFMGLAGPALVKAGVGETVEAEAIGGAAAQVDRNGLAHLGAEDEPAAIAALRRFLSYLPSNARAPLPMQPAPAEDPDRQRSLETLVPIATRRAYDVRRVAEVLADEGSLFEIKPTHARNAFCALARLGGRPVGIIANNPMHLGGMLTAAACEKIAHFTAVCDAFGLPLVHLIDVPGFAVGTAAEASVLGRRSARLLWELGHATVPRVSVVLRKGYGLGYFAMNGGRVFDPDACFAWPSAEICAMSIEGAVDVVHRRAIEAAPDPAAHRDALIAADRARVTPFGGAESFGLDDILAPAETRARLIEVLDRAPARRDAGQPPKHRAISPI